MGRELRRKQAKKEGKSLKREEINEKNPIKKLLIIILVLLFIMVVIYLLSALFITKELDWFNKNTNESTTTNVTDSILASSIFKQIEEEYYVYFYDFSDEDAEITNTINNALPAEKVYKVDTSSAMNANYVSENSNPSAKTLSEISVVPNTLIKISGESIAEYYENDEIINKLQ